MDFFCRFVSGFRGIGREKKIIGWFKIQNKKKKNSRKKWRNRAICWNSVFDSVTIDWLIDISAIETGFSSIVRSAASTSRSSRDSRSIAASYPQQDRPPVLKRSHPRSFQPSNPRLRPFRLPASSPTKMPPLVEVSPLFPRIPPLTKEKEKKKKEKKRKKKKKYLTSKSLYFIG